MTQRREADLQTLGSSVLVADMRVSSSKCIDVGKRSTLSIRSSGTVQVGEKRNGFETD